MSIKMRINHLPRRLANIYQFLARLAQPSKRSTRTSRRKLRQRSPCEKHTHQTHTCTGAHMHTRTNTHAHTHTCTGAHTHTHTDAHVHKHTRTRAQAHTRTRTQACTFAFQTGGGEETGEPGASTCSPPRSNRRGGVGDRGVCDGERVHAVTAVVMRRAHRRTHIGDLALPGTTAKFCTSVTSINHRKDLMCLYYYYPHSAQEGADGQE